MPDGFLGHLFFGKRLDQFVMDKQSIYIFEFFVCRIRRLKFDGTALFTISYADSDSPLYQFFLVF